MQQTTTWARWNNRELFLSDLQISVEDRAFYFGDAVYEVIRVYAGTAFLLKEHLQRLDDSLEKLSLRFDTSYLQEWIVDNIRKNRITSGYVYLQISRGTAPREHAFPKDAAGNLLLYTKPLPEDPYADLRVKGASVITLPDIRWKRRDIKTVNLLANCMAKEQAIQAGCYEAIQYEEDLTITEGATSNVFIVKDGILKTPPKTHKILPGITRDFVIGLADQLGVQVRQTDVTKDELMAADEAFLTSTSAEVLPIAMIDNHSLHLRECSLTYNLCRAFQKKKPLSS